MAIPGTPSSVVVEPGLNRQSVRISWGASTNTPTTYEVYWSNVTGVSSSDYRGNRTIAADRVFLAVEGTPYNKVFATVVGTNVDGSSADATEASGWASD